MPRVIWMFWAQGMAGLGPFRRACIQSWVCHNPGWRVVLLGIPSCFSYIDRSDLPDKWQCLCWPALSDAVRLSLLSRHGGVYVDVSVICGRSLDDWLHSSEDHCLDLEAFYYPNFGASHHCNRGEYLENWFLACPRGSGLMSRWHSAFLDFWKGRANASEGGGLLASKMFQGIDLSGMREDQTNYLTMHCCFKMVDRFWPLGSKTLANSYSSTFSWWCSRLDSGARWCWGKLDTDECCWPSCSTVALQERYCLGWWSSDKVPRC